MKINLFLLSLCLLAPAIQAQKPEKIYPNSVEHKSIPYLKEQSTLWKKEVEKDPKNVVAWYNYYYANRNLGFNDTTDKRSPQEKYDYLKNLVEDMGKSIPNSYEYNLCKWMAGQWDMSLLPYLKKAQELGPDRTEHLDYSIVLGEIEGNKQKRDESSRKKEELGMVSTGMMYYNYNVLMGLAPNAILLTCGDNDTYPIWALQAKGIRTDVTVLHLYLVGLDEYKNTLFKQLGIENWPLKNSDSAKNSKDKNVIGCNKKDIISHIAANKKNLPVYLALTAAGDEAYTKSIEDKLFLTGLAYQYSREPVDNIALLKKNFEQQYALDYVEKAFYQDISPGLVGFLNGNYIVPMLKLYDHYKIAGDTPHMEWIKQKMLAICKGSPDEAEIKKHLTLK